MKPHASIFQAALAAVRVPASEAVMVGDSYAHDVVGAEAVEMRGILFSRDGRGAPAGSTTTVIRSLTELLPLL